MRSRKNAVLYESAGSIYFISINLGCLGKNAMEGIYTPNRDIITSNGNNMSIERIVLFLIVQLRRTGLVACIL
jgi:hypothetical protein